MGTNFPTFLIEANRVLKVGGKLFVAEVVSRFENRNTFVNDDMPQLTGFKCLSSKVLHDFFYIMVFRKEKEVSDLKFDKIRMEEFKRSLKPCIYKRR